MIKFNKKQIDDMDKIDNMVKDLDNCGDKYCGNIITSDKLKEEGIKFLRNVTKKCRSKREPTNRKEFKLQFKKYNKCFTKYKKGTKYYKKLTKRKKCEDKKCSVYQKKIQKMLSSKKNR
jgi:hypothetical protein